MAGTILVPRGRVGVPDLLTLLAAFGPRGEGTDQANLLIDVESGHDGP